VSPLHFTAVLCALTLPVVVIVLLDRRDGGD
jgi:hypothetical protein